MSTSASRTLRTWTSALPVSSIKIELKQLHNRTVFVTGGAGFVGSHLVRSLLREGAKVHLLVRLETNLWRLEDVLKKVTIWYGDITDAMLLHQTLQKVQPEFLFHLAGVTNVRRLDDDFRQVDESIETNLKGMLALLKAAYFSGSSLQCFLRAGGLEEYGQAPPPYHEEQREQPVSPYSASQVATTHYCQMLQPYCRFPIVTLRPALIYGAAQSTDFFIPSLIEHCLTGRDFAMSSGEQSRDLIYIADVIDAFIGAAMVVEEGTIINIGTGKAHRMREVADIILQLTGAQIRLQIGAILQRPFEIQNLYCQNEKAQRLLGWSAKTDLVEGLRQTIDWYRNH